MRRMIRLLLLDQGGWGVWMGECVGGGGGGGVGACVCVCVCVCVCACVCVVVRMHIWYMSKRMQQTCRGGTD